MELSSLLDVLSGAWIDDVLVWAVAVVAGIVGARRARQRARHVPGRRASRLTSFRAPRTTPRISMTPQNKAAAGRRPKARRRPPTPSRSSWPASPATAPSQLTTNQGLQIPDNHNSLKAGVRGPTLLEDFILREKITHFDHERIPERVVHARGSAAHGYFQVYKSMSQFTCADFLQDPAAEDARFRALLDRRRLARLGRHGARRARLRRQVLHAARATTTWWATTSRCSSSRTR